MKSTTKNNEWYTPSKYIEAARVVMGSIDLDPASCAAANQAVKATRYYDEEVNGLAQPWYGKVWLNPPFGLIPVPNGAAWQGKSRAGVFIQRLLWEYKEGNIEQAVLLAKADPKQHWFLPLWDFPICFASDRIYFRRPNNLPPERFQFGVAFVYLGLNESKFIEIFSKFGTIAKRVSTPPVKPVMRELWEVTA
jgi:DNA N-6-adenine-methyltransferase (Dam)